MERWAERNRTIDRQTVYLQTYTDIHKETERTQTNRQGSRQTHRERGADRERD